LQHRGLDFQIALSVEIFPHGTGHFHAPQKPRPRVFVDKQVYRALPVAHFGVFQAARLLFLAIIGFILFAERQGPEGLRQQYPFAHMHRDFAALGPKDKPRNTGNVAQIQVMLDVVE